MPESVLSIRSLRSSSASRSSEPPLPLPGRLQLRPQHLVLGIPRLHHSTQPRQQLTLLRSVVRHGLIGHAPEAPTPAATSQIDERGSHAG